MQVYRDEYRRKLTTPEGAIQRIQDDDTIVHGVTLAEPPALLGAIAERARAGNMERVTIYSFNPQKHAAETYLKADLQDRLFARSWFLSPPARKLAAVGLVQFIPCYLHQVPKFLRENMRVDVCVTTVSPMDNAGFFSFGTANDLTSTAARLARTLIVEVNEHMPRVFGDSMVHISEVDAVVENHAPLMQIPPPEPKEQDAIIGRLIAEYVMDPVVIAQNDNMIAVNSIIQVDLTGQCNAEYLAGHMYSGTGGQLDFVRGAYAAKNGKSIMAFYATAQDGTLSRVVSRLDPNAAVTTPRGDVQYLCTEYGLVDLKNKSLGERAEAIISLAHPKFREELTLEAEKMQLF
jgi:acyl-CoA hydrolase